MKKLAVIAFGGNALLRGGQRGTYREQMENVTRTCESLLPFLKNDYNLVIGHGNGPQVGNVMLQNEAGNQVFNVPDMPIDFCVAETQGLIGFMIEMGLDKVFAKEGNRRNVVTLVTQVIVDKDDPMFQTPPSLWAPTTPRSRPTNTQPRRVLFIRKTRKAAVGARWWLLPSPSASRTLTS